jgi:protein O-mannosyl-transferase
MFYSFFAASRLRVSRRFFDFLHRFLLAFLRMAKSQQKPRPADSARRQSRQWFIYLMLLAATLAVYSQVRSYDFVNYDDREYVSENARVRAGLTPDGAAWAMTSTFEGNWFPLTWLSHMLDCQVFGLDGGLHHLTNVLLHILSTLLLFAWLHRMTGAAWRSAAVAFLFALHPLHVESVAWVTERKDALSAFFWFLTLWAYVRYARKPGTARYLPVLAFFCLGLMSKSMVITLPFILLLLDFWPLRRIWAAEAAASVKGKPKAAPMNHAKARLGTILLEKVPFFALSAGIAVITFIAQGKGGAVASLARIPFGRRVANALISYMIYLLQMFWPARLAVFYPLPSTIPVWQVIAALLALLGITAMVLRWLHRFPYLTVGWFWYLGTLVPVIGLVQVGMQAHADRYAYLPLVGIFMMLAWGLAEWVERRPQIRIAVAGISAAACLALAVLTWRQIRSWQDSRTLFQHAIEVTANNHVAHNGLGVALREQNRVNEAAAHFVEAIRMQPGYPEAHANLGDAYLLLGRIEDAAKELTEAIRLNPDSPEACISLGIAYSKLGKVNESIAALAAAVKRYPDAADAHYNLGRVYVDAGRIQEATAEFYQAARLQPENAEAHYNLGSALASQGNMEAAVAEFARAVQLKPDYAAAHHNFGSALATLGRLDEAIAEFTEALRLAPDSVETRRVLDYARSLKK